MSSSYILDINPLSDIQFANILSHLVGCIFILLLVSFVVQKLFGQKQSHFVFRVVFFFFFLVGFFVCLFVFRLCFWCEKIMAKTYQGDYCLGFVVEVFGFRSQVQLLTHFQLIFVCGVAEQSIIILLLMAVQFSQHCLLKTNLSPLYIFGSFIVNLLTIYV